MTNDELLDKAIRRVPDFPKPGILFYDITSVLTQPEVFKHCIDRMLELYKDVHFDAVAAAESRGFLFAAPFAEKLGLPLVLVRKKGKLPGDVYRTSYALEYGTAEIEIHKSDVQKGASYLLVDDLIATGGTLDAARRLIEMGGGTVSDVFGVIGLPDLNYEEALKPMKVSTLINFSGK
ncbi:MAG: adenine phosphoribosyltransferase [Treponema sp.]|nr:adenine phosphoribosyltransferase [Treponema sp.]